MQNDPHENNIDISLWEKVKSGNKTAYKTLFEKYYPELVRFAWLYTKDEDTTEELVQDFFVQFWVKREQINITSSVKSYLYKAVRNKALNYKRDTKNDLSLESDSSLINLACNEQDTGRFDFHLLENQVKLAVNSLPEKCRKIFLLSREENLTYKEIAEQMNVSQKTVENQMGIALKKLREKLKPLINNLIFLIITLLLKK